MNWYALQVLTGTERDVCTALRRKGVKARAPDQRMEIRRRGQWQTEDRLLLPGYVFVGADYTGLCAYLSMWLTPDTLRNGAASGHYYENYVVMELVKNYAYAKSKVNLTYFRDSNAKEIDVFVEENNFIHPLEIKKSAAPDRREVKKYSVLDKASLNRGNGGIICMCEEPIPIDADNCFIPSNLI